MSSRPAPRRAQDPAHAGVADEEPTTTDPAPATDPAAVDPADETPEGERRWHLASGSVEDALSVIAADAIGILSGERDGKLALCASPTCRAAFFDTSQSRSRKWCDMNTCGNRQKKARFHAKQRKGPATAE